MKALAATLLLVACGARDASPNRYAGPRYQDRYSAADVTKYNNRERGRFFDIKLVEEAASVIVDAIDAVTGEDAIINDGDSQIENLDDAIALHEMKQVLEDFLDTVADSVSKPDVRGEAEDDENVFDEPESSRNYDEPESSRSYDDSEPVAPARDSDYQVENAWRRAISSAGRTLGKKLLEEGASRAFNEGRQNLGTYLRNDGRRRSGSPPRSSSSSYSYGSPHYHNLRQSSPSRHTPLYNIASQYHNWSRYKL